MESTNKKIDYFNKLKCIIDYEDCPKEEIFQAKLILIDEVISNSGLTEMDTKDLLTYIVKSL